jgi:hypothetical protein
MALSSRTLTLMKWLYWIVLLGAHVAICYFLFSMGRPIVGVIWAIMGLILIYLFYPVYFPPGDPGSSWPPYITACPDYLTLIAPNACVDYVGMGSPILKKADPSNPPQAGDTNYFFDPSGTKSQKAAKAQQYGLTWEGIV